MLATRYSPTLRQARKYDLFNEFLNSFNSMLEEEPREVFDFVPTVNTREGKEAYHIEMDLPGVKKKDVEISVDKNILTIKGKREIRNETKEDDYYRIESAYGSFQRSFTLPEKVDIENIRAVSEDGVVEIIIPKLKTVEDTTKKIKIE